MVSGSVSLTERLCWILNILFHQGVAVITVYILRIVFETFDSSSVLAWHVTLCTIGFITLALEGIILFHKDNVPTLFIDRKQKALIHSCVLGFGTVCIVTGIAIKIDNQLGDHFSTTHGAVGLSAMIFLLVTAIIGPILTLLKGLGRPVIFKLIHSCLGLVTVILGATTLCLGLDKYGASPKDTKTAAYVGISLLLLWTSVGAVKSIYNHIKNILG